MIALLLEMQKLFKEQDKRIDRLRIDIVQGRIDLLNVLRPILNDITERLIIIEGKEDKIMSQVAKDFESLRVAIDDATNLVASEIEQLNGKISNSMTEEEVTNLKSGFTALVDKLHGLAANPNDPIPDDPPPDPDPVV